jgi:hypothetical protein
MTVRTLNQFDKDQLELLLIMYENSYNWEQLREHINYKHPGMQGSSLRIRLHKAVNEMEALACNNKAGVEQL